MLVSWLTFPLSPSLSSEPDDNAAPSEVHPVFADTGNSSSISNGSKSNSSVVASKPARYEEMIKYDQVIDRRSGDLHTSQSHIPPPVIDEEAEKDRKLEAHSFGFKVTVYRTPGHKGKFACTWRDGEVN